MPPSTVRTLPPGPVESTPSSLGVHDILFILFKYKRTILVCALLGLLAAAAVFFFYPPVYQSQAKLLVRYVVERSAVDAVDSTANTAANRGNLPTAAIASEAEILTSWDLAVQVAEAIGPQRLVPDAKTPPSSARAAAVIIRGLKVDAPKNGNILLVSYENHDPALATLVLKELVNRYFIKHLEVHRSAGAFDFVTQQTDQVRARLNQTEDALKPLKADAGMVSLAESKAAISASLARTEEQLNAAEAEFAEQQARVLALTNSAASATAPKQKSEGSPAASSPVPENAEKSAPEAAPEIPPAQVAQYQDLTTRLEQLRQSKVEQLSKFKPGSVQVKLTQSQLDDFEGQRAEMEKQYPGLPLTLTRTGGGTARATSDLATEKAQLAGLAAKLDVLKARLAETQARFKKLNDIGPQVAELERRKEIEEANYKYFQATLEKSRIDEALDPSKIPNISAVQKPSPPAIVTNARNKLALGLAGGGLALGLAIALLLDLVLNRTVKRSMELERQLQTPILLSIPDTPKNGRLALPSHDQDEAAGIVEPDRNGRGANGSSIAPWSPGHFIRPYCEAIRDRLGLYFELNNLTHKPKLVGVTSFGHDAGTSTLAAGLASALSETDEGKVLLVDVNLGPGDVHPFFRGKPAYTLANALQPSESMDAAADNLYLATVGSAKSGPAQLGLKRFFDLMPNLKASDFDYIIFDMPPLEQTSPTWALSPFMDKMLLIVQAETTNRDAVKRGYRKLTTERDNVAVVFNKAPSYGPGWIDGDN